MNIDPQFRSFRSIRAGDPTSLRSLIEKQVISLLKTDASAKISVPMKEFWLTKTRNQKLTFAPGTSLDILEKLDYDDALKKYSLGSDYDERLCKVEVNFRAEYSDLDLAYHANITDMTLQLNFMYAVCSNIKQGTYSKDELILMKKNWTKFLVTKTEEKWMDFLHIKRKTRYLADAFSEQGVTMVSRILNSDKAINMNIAQPFLKPEEICFTTASLSFHNCLWKEKK